MTQRPLVGTMIGDPCGIGPEVTVRAWATGEVHRHSRPILIGCMQAVQNAVDVCGLSLEVKRIRTPAECHDSPQVIDVIDSGALRPTDITPGADNALCGRACAVWLDEADALARSGALAATVMAPISTGAMKMGGVIDRVVSPTPGESYLLLLTGPLRVIHLTDHLPLRQVCNLISTDLVLSALRLVHHTLEKWGIARPRIGVAGLNPHAMGHEDQEIIAPAVRAAADAGIRITGPISPDTIFRHCIEGRYDIVLAMYHDQGHIAVKTWGFSGNSVAILGPPYVHMSVAHGTAYDIVGRGIADHSMMLNAMATAGSLAAGRGFIEQTTGGAAGDAPQGVASAAA